MIVKVKFVPLDEVIVSLFWPVLSETKYEWIGL